MEIPQSFQASYEQRQFLKPKLSTQWRQIWIASLCLTSKHNHTRMTEFRNNECTVYCVVCSVLNSVITFFTRLNIIRNSDYEDLALQDASRNVVIWRDDLLQMLSIWTSSLLITKRGAFYLSPKPGSSVRHLLSGTFLFREEMLGPNCNGSQLSSN